MASAGHMTDEAWRIGLMTSFQRMLLSYAGNGLWKVSVKWRLCSAN